MKFNLDTKHFPAPSPSPGNTIGGGTTEETNHRSELTLDVISDRDATNVNQTI